MYSTKVIGMFASPTQLPRPILYNEIAETRNHRNVVSTFNGRLIYTYGNIFPFSKENLKIYSKISKLNEEKIDKLDPKAIYDHLKNDFKLNYPNIEDFKTLNTMVFLAKDKFVDTFKNLSDFIPECKKSKTKRTEEELENLKNKLLEKYSTFKITPYVKDSRQNYFENRYLDRFMIENGNINILNFLDELSLRGNSREYYEKSFSGLIYDETYGKKVIDIDSFLEYSNNIDGLLDSIDQIFTDKKFKNLEEKVTTYLNSEKDLNELTIFNFEFEKTNDFPIKVNVKLKDSIVENCKENTSNLENLNKLIDENNICGHFKIYNEKEVHFYNNKNNRLNIEPITLESLLYDDVLTNKIIDPLIENQIPYNPLESIMEELLERVDNLNLKKCKIEIDGVNITSKVKLDKILQQYKDGNLMDEEFNIVIKTPYDKLQIWSEIQPYVMVSDQEDGMLYTGIPQLNKNDFESEMFSVLDYHINEYRIINKDKEEIDLDR